jgi:hypothetical protein
MLSSRAAHGAGAAALRTHMQRPGAARAAHDAPLAPRAAAAQPGAELTIRRPDDWRVRRDQRRAHAAPPR